MTTIRFRLGVALAVALLPVLLLGVLLLGMLLCCGMLWGLGTWRGCSTALWGCMLGRRMWSPAPVVAAITLCGSGCCKGQNRGG